MSCKARGGFHVWGLSWEQQCGKSLTNDTIKLRFTKGQDILVSGVLMFIILFNTTAQLHASPLPNVPTYFSVSHSSHFRFFEVLHSNKTSSSTWGSDSAHSVDLRWPMSTAVQQSVYSVSIVHKRRQRHSHSINTDSSSAAPRDLNSWVGQRLKEHYKMAISTRRFSRDKANSVVM